MKVAVYERVLVRLAEVDIESLEPRLWDGFEHGGKLYRVAALSLGEQVEMEVERVDWGQRKLENR